LAVIVAGSLGLLLTGCQSMKPDLDSAEGLYKSGDKPGALAIYERLLATRPSRAKTTMLEVKVSGLRKEITDDTLAQVNSFKSGGESIPALDKCVKLLAAKQSFDDSGNRLKTALDAAQELLAKLRNEYDRLLAAAKAGEPNNEWTPVYQSLARAAQLNPDPGLDRRIADWVKKRDTAYAAIIEEALGQKQLGRADEQFTKYAGEIPKPGDLLLADLGAKVEALRRVQLEDQLNQLVEKKKFYTAYQLIRGAKKPYLSQRESEIRQGGADYYKANAKKDKDKVLGAGDDSRIAFGYFAAVKGKELSSQDDPDIFELHKFFSDKLEAKISQSIAIPTFTTPAAEPDAGKAFANALTVYMKDHVPYGITILERSVLVDKILAEHGAKALVDLTTNNEFAQVKFFIAGDVTNLKVEHIEDAHHGTARILLGKEFVSDPMYLQCLARYGNNQRKWPPQFRELAPEKEVARYDKATYDYGTKTVDAEIKVSVQTIEAGGGAITEAIIFTNHFYTNGIYSDSVPNAEPPVKGASLQLPSDIVIKENMHQSVAKQVGEFAMSKLFEKREDRFFGAAKKSIERREYRDAVANLAGGYYYCTKDPRLVPKKDENATYTALREGGMLVYTEDPEKYEADAK
jgi:hypothetical protein